MLFRSLTVRHSLGRGVLFSQSGPSPRYPLADSEHSTEYGEQAGCRQGRRLRPQKPTCAIHGRSPDCTCQQRDDIQRCPVVPVHIRFRHDSIPIPQAKQTPPHMIRTIRETTIGTRIRSPQVSAREWRGGCRLRAWRLSTGAHSFGRALVRGALRPSAPVQVFQRVGCML